MTSPSPGHVLHRFCSACDVEYDDEAPGAIEKCPTCGGKLVEIRSTPDEAIGQVIDDRFEIRALLGEGGMGTVYRAWQRSIGREVAIKLMDRKFSRDAMGVKRFLREARLASQLSQPNTVSIFDFGQSSDGRLFIAMELIRGRTLFEILSDEGRFTAARAARVGIQICDALEAAHGLKIVHRDLKLENVIVLDDPPGRDLVKVLDFGLAKNLDDDGSHATQSGVVVGTPRYMAPEAAMNGQSLRAGDLYALGVILGELVIGAPLWTETSFPALVSSKLEPKTALAQVPPPMHDLVGELISPDPEQRPTAAQTRALLHAIADDTSAAAPGSSKVSPMAATIEMRTPAPRAGAKAPLIELPNVRFDAPTESSDAGAGASIPLATPRPLATTPAPQRVPVPPTSTAPVTPPRGRGLWIALAVVAAGAVAAVILITGRGGDEPEAPRAGSAPTAGATPSTGSASGSAQASASGSAPASGSSIEIASPAASASRSPATSAEPAAGTPVPTIVLHVRTHPSPATVLVDGHAVGPSPIDLPVPRGATPLTIGVRAGGRTITKHVTPDRERNVELTLPATPPQSTPPAGSDSTPF